MLAENGTPMWNRRYTQDLHDLECRRGAFIRLLKSSLRSPRLLSHGSI
jgi:hypothetical protein